MYTWGHVGAALFCYAPAGAALTYHGEPALALVGAGVAIAFATFPDADELDLVPLEHRGTTHTVWFVAVCSLLLAAVGWAVGSLLGLSPGLLAATVGGAGAISLTSHLLADSITPMGIRPFYPLSMWHHSFGVTPAKNPRANTTMLAVGVLFALACQAVVVIVAG